MKINTLGRKMAKKARKVEANPGLSATNLIEHQNPHVIKRELRAILRDAFDQLGGAQWLVDFVRRDDSNAKAFLQVLGRTMPLELLGADKAPVTITILSADGTVERVDMEPKSVPPQLPYKLDS